MASVAAERAAIGQVDTLLQDTATASARALADRSFRLRIVLRQDAWRRLNDGHRGA